VCACCDDLAEPAPGVSDEAQQWILSLDHTLEDDPTLPVSTHVGHRVHNVRRSHLARCVPPSQCADGCLATLRSAAWVTRLLLGYWEASHGRLSRPVPRSAVLGWGAAERTVDDLPGQDADLDVPGLGIAGQEGECLVLVDAVALHKDAYRGADVGAGVQRRAQLLDLCGIPKEGAALVRRDDGHEVLVFPGTDASVEHAQSPKQT